MPLLAQHEGHGNSDDNARQDDGRRDMSNGLERMSTHLGLSDTQKLELETILSANRTAMTAVRESGVRPTPEQQEAYRNQMRDQIATILTTEQLATFNQMQERMLTNAQQQRERMQERAPGMQMRERNADRDTQ